MNPIPKPREEVPKKKKKQESKASRKSACQSGSRMRLSRCQSGNTNNRHSTPPDTLSLLRYSSLDVRCVRAHFAVLNEKIRLFVGGCWHCRLPSFLPFWHSSIPPLLHLYGICFSCCFLFISQHVRQVKHSHLTWSWSKSSGKLG